jgi:hypothetical protein
MAYNPTISQPLLVAGGVGASPRMWMYTSGDVGATVDASGYFTDGYSLGMRDGDLCLVYNSASKIWTAHTVVNAAGTTIDLADGTTVGSSTNSD